MFAVDGLLCGVMSVDFFESSVGDFAGVDLILVNIAVVITATVVRIAALWLEVAPVFFGSGSGLSSLMEAFTVRSCSSVRLRSNNDTRICSRNFPRGKPLSSAATKRLARSSAFPVNVKSRMNSFPRLSP